MAETMELWASRIKNADPATHVGEVNRIFYYPDSGTLRISDGVTPGGLPINLTGNLANIAIANFVFNGTTITTSVPNAAIAIQSNGSGGNIDLLPGEQINIGGALHVHASGNLNAAPSFDVASTGDVTILAPTSGYTSGVNIIGSSTGTELVPQNTGVMLHITGQDADPSRIYNDGNSAYATYIGRRFNGTVASPTQVLDSEVISRIGSTPYTNTGWPLSSTARINFVAHGDQSSSNYGANIEFWTTPLNSTTLTRAAYINGDTLYSNNLTTLGNVTIKSTGNVSNIGVLQVTNNSNGNVRYPVLANVLAQFTGKDNTTPYIVFDGYGNVNSSATSGQFVFRSGRGNLATPAAVQNNDSLGAIGAAGWGDTGYGGVYASSIEFKAAGTFTDSSRPGKIVLSAVPALSASPSTIVTFTPNQTTFADNHLVANAWINVPAGTTAQAPLQFAPGVLPTVSTPGALDYNGTAFYGVPTGLQIGVIPTQQQFVLNGTHNLTQGSTALQSVFGKSVGISADTRYYYKITLKIAKQGPQASVIYYALGLSNGLTLTNHRYRVDSSVTNADTGVSATYSTSQYKTTNFSVAAAVTPAMTTSNPDYAMVTIEGYIGTGVAGTLTPQISFDPAPVTSISIQPLSSMWIYPVASATGNVSIGTWA
jgi:hypothetical protein